MRVRTNQAGATLKLTDGIRRVSGFLPAVAGVDTAVLVQDARQYLVVVGMTSGNDTGETLPEPPQVRNIAPLA